jgi:RNA polymerase sigma factor (sigma-70 family)
VCKCRIIEQNTEKSNAIGAFYRSLSVPHKGFHYEPELINCLNGSRTLPFGWSGFLFFLTLNPASVINVAFQKNIRRSDQEIIDMICLSTTTRNQAIEEIYHWNDLKLKVQGYVLQHGGSISEALEIYHEGIIVLDRNIRTGKYEPVATLQAYLYSICRFIWKNERRKKQKISDRDPSDHDDEVDHITPEITFFQEERKLQLKKVLELLDDSCRKILTLWKMSYSMEEIARSLNLSSGDMAKKYKYRCMKKLMVVLDQKPNLLESLQ